MRQRSQVLESAFSSESVDLITEACDGFARIKLPVPVFVQSRYGDVCSSRQIQAGFVDAFEIDQAGNVLVEINTDDELDLSEYNISVFIRTPVESNCKANLSAVMLIPKIKLVASD